MLVITIEIFPLLVVLVFLMYFCVWIASETNSAHRERMWKAGNSIYLGSCMTAYVLSPHLFFCLDWLSAYVWADQNYELKSWTSATLLFPHSITYLNPSFDFSYFYVIITFLLSIAVHLTFLSEFSLLQLIWIKGKGKMDLGYSSDSTEWETEILSLATTLISREFHL